MKRFIFFLGVYLLIFGCQSQNNKAEENSGRNTVSFVEETEEKRVEVYFDSSLFTAYIYPDEITKPVLWPVSTVSGHVITRNYPLRNVEGERTDHPHHIGIWLTYGDVNGIDYWNNSSAIPSEEKNKYGWIDHQKVISMTTSGNEGVLKVQCQWVDHGGLSMNEETKFTFINRGSIRIIDRITELTALKDVIFEDNKEGMLGMRMVSELEMPSDQEITLTDAHGNPTTVKGKNSKANGNYISSEGLTGDDVWGTRADWMDLSGRMGDKKVDIVMIDHPDNPGYPTYWHARGYGLYAANPLGQKEFSGGDESLHFKLNKGEKATFKYRIVISEDQTAGVDKWQELAKEFQ